MPPRSSDSMHLPAGEDAAYTQKGTITYHFALQ
jgi:hypothetical protein